MKNIDFSKFADKFIDDAHNLLNELEGMLLELEQAPGNHQLIESVFRSMHTLKGIGSMFGFNIISEYTHHLETIYDKIREGAIKVDSSIFEITFSSVDHLRYLLTDKELKQKELAERHHTLLKQLEMLELSKIEIEAEEHEPLHLKKHDPSATWYIQFICSEELEKRAVNIEFLFQDLSKLGKYSIFNHSAEYNNNMGVEEEMWGIILTTTCGYQEIEEVFMFVIENVKIIQLSDEIPVFQDSKNGKKKLAGTINDLAREFVFEEEITIKTEVEEKDQSQVAGKTPRISVGADKLDKLMYLVSELFTTRSELVIASRNGEISRIKLAVEKLDKLSIQFRKNALSIRLVPLRELTLKLKRLVRDLGKQLGKNIDFEIKGDDTELDKNLVDSLADPLMHLIRNCVDHGIELPAERKANDKPVNGTVKFVAYQSGNHIFIEISDDGKGIDTAKIRHKALEKGIITAGAQLSEKELLNLIFLPGFSTTQNITQISGRGVGMDVVKRAVTDLRGSIDLETEIGKGTSFTLKLQQTISIMDTLLVQSGNTFFTIILEEVEFCGLQSHKELLEKQNNHVEVAGELIPYISLRKTFSIPGDQPETERLVVVKRQNIKYAIIVDDIVGQYQAVIKPLSSVLKNKDYLSGASIMGDGNIAFMLDTYKLSGYSHKQE